MSDEPPVGDPGLTRVWRAPSDGSDLGNREILLQVYRALQEKGYDPIMQLAHFLLSGEPTYITAHGGARTLVSRLERDEVIAELLRLYVATLTQELPPEPKL